MNVTGDDARLPSSLSARLRGEARSTRPNFSETFHTRLMDRIAVEPVSLPSPRQDMPRRRWRGLVRLAVPAGVAVTLAVVVAIFASGRMSSGPAGGSALIASTDRHVAGDMPSVGIESLPMYDDIDAGVRASVWMLASSLVEVPDWASLEDFDGPAIAPDAAGP